MMTEELIERLAEAGYVNATPAVHAVFENIDRGGTRITILAERAEMTRQSMSELIAVLERRGWVERRPDPDDRRAQIVRLTPEGKRLARTALAIIDDIEGRWQERWRRAGSRANLKRIVEAALAGATRQSARGE